MVAHPAQSLALDRCTACQGLWFDTGELRQHLAERFQKPHLRL